MKQWLYRIQPVRRELLTAGGTAGEKATLAQHFAYLQRLTEEGVVQLAGRTLTTDYLSFGLVMFRAPDEAAAMAIMQQDPAVQAGIFRAELFPWRVALSSGAGDG